MRFLVATFLLFFFTTIGRLQAGTEISGGGYAVFCNGQDNSKTVEIFDYYEGKELYQKNKFLLDAIEGNYQQKLEYLITLLEKLDPQRASTFYEILNDFDNWAIFLKRGLIKDINDNQSPIDPEKGCIAKQVAVQIKDPLPNSPKLLIDRDAWEKMDDTNKAGLLMHELWYGELLKSPSYNESSDVTVRYLNYLFASDLIDHFDIVNYGSLIAKRAKLYFYLSMFGYNFSLSPNSEGSSNEICRGESALSQKLKNVFKNVSIPGFDEQDRIFRQVCLVSSKGFQKDQTKESTIQLSMYFKSEILATYQGFFPNGYEMDGLRTDGKVVLSLDGKQGKNNFTYGMFTFSPLHYVGLYSDGLPKHLYSPVSTNKISVGDLGLKSTDVIFSEKGPKATRLIFADLFRGETLLGKIENASLEQENGGILVEKLTIGDEIVHLTQDNGVILTFNPNEVVKEIKFNAKGKVISYK